MVNAPGFFGYRWLEIFVVLQRHPGHVWFLDNQMHLTVIGELVHLVDSSEIPMGVLLTGCRGWLLHVYIALLARAVEFAFTWG